VRRCNACQRRRIRVLQAGEEVVQLIELGLRDPLTGVCAFITLGAEVRAGGCAKKIARVFNPGVGSLACVWRSVLFLLFDGLVSGFASSCSEPMLSLNSWLSDFTFEGPVSASLVVEVAMAVPQSPASHSM
jgi:hypothetical protein